MLEQLILHDKVRGLNTYPSWHWQLPFTDEGRSITLPNWSHLSSQLNVVEFQMYPARQVHLVVDPETRPTALSMLKQSIVQILVVGSKTKWVSLHPQVYLLATATPRLKVEQSRSHVLDVEFHVKPVRHWQSTLLLGGALVFAMAEQLIWQKVSSALQ